MDSRQLSDREIDILKLVAQAKSNKEIAAQLFISVNTVKVHLANIFQKIGVVSRTEAALYAIEKGIHTPVLPLADILQKIEPEDTAKTGAITRDKSSKTTLLLIGVVVITLLFGLFALERFYARNNTNTDSLLSTLTNNRWQKLRNLPQGMSRMAVVSYDNQIFIVGGVDSTGVRSNTAVFDPVSQEWKTLAEKPTAVSDISAAVLGGKLFVPGGQQADGSLSASLEVFDPRANRWETKKNLPLPVANCGIVSHEGNLYLFGGWDGQKELNLVLRYDPNSDVWSKMAPLPTARSSSSVIKLGDSIFVVGGICDGQPCLSTEVYTSNLDNGTDNPWSEQLSLENDVRFIGGQEVSGMLFFFSLEENGGIRLRNFVPQNNTWSTYTEAPTNLPSEQSQITTLGGHVYFIGGIDEAGKPSSKVVRYQAVFTIVLPQIAN